MGIVRRERFIRNNMKKTQTTITDTISNTTNERSVLNINAKDQYFKDMFEVDTGQDTDNVHIVSKRFLDTGQYPTPQIINQVLNLTHDDAVTHDSLQEFNSIEPVHIPLLPVSKEKGDLILSLAKEQGGSLHGYGAYVFTNTATGEQYVGGSRNVLDRVRQHIRGNATSMLHHHLELLGASNFSVDIYLLPAHTLTAERVLALEQFLIFKLNPTINRSKVANSTNRVLQAEELAQHRLATGTPLYIYHEDKLIHRFSAIREASLALGRLPGFLLTVLQYSKGLYRGGLQFSRILDPTKQVELVSLDSLLAIFNKLTATGKRNTPISPRNAKSITVQSLADNSITTFNTTKEFLEHLKYTPTQIKTQRTNLNNAIKSNRPFLRSTF